MGEWQLRVGMSGWGWLDGFVATSPTSSPSLGRRIAVLAGQGVAAGVLYAVTRRSLTATRVVTTGPCLGWGAAFVMHVAMPACIRSAIPRPGDLLVWLLLRPDNLDGFYRVCRGAGIPATGSGWPRLNPPAVETSGVGIAYLVDPDGTLVRLVENQP